RRRGGRGAQGDRGPQRALRVRAPRGPVADRVPAGEAGAGPQEVRRPARQRPGPGRLVRPRRDGLHPVTARRPRRSPSWLAVLTAGLALVGAGACSPAITAGSGAAPYGSVGEDCDSYGATAAPTPSASAIPTIHLPADAVLVLATRCTFTM